jgi:hypothetical protein
MYIHGADAILGHGLKTSEFVTQVFRECDVLGTLDAARRIDITCRKDDPTQVLDRYSDDWWNHLDTQCSGILENMETFPGKAEEHNARLQQILVCTAFDINSMLNLPCIIR